MVTNGKPVILNLGCGYKKLAGAINVDAYPVCNPDFVWDLNLTPYPWDDNSVDAIYVHHVMEHLENWWEAFRECSRILKTGGTVEVRVPDASSDSALAYRDHLHVFTGYSFNGVIGQDGKNRDGSPTNAWFESQDKVPLKLIFYGQVPFPEYQKWWMPNWVLRFCARHLRNFIWEQRFTFQKMEVV